MSFPVGGSGVGIRAERSDAGYVVTHLKRKGAAEQNGVLKVGDLLVTVDGVDVATSLSALPSLILGPKGTATTIGFRRDPGGPLYHVTLVRGGGTEEEALNISRQSLSSYGDTEAFQSSHGRPHTSQGISATASDIEYPADQTATWAMDETAEQIDARRAMTVTPAREFSAPYGAKEDAENADESPSRLRCIALIPGTGPVPYVKPGSHVQLDLSEVNGQIVLRRSPRTEKTLTAGYRLVKSREADTEDLIRTTERSQRDKKSEHEQALAIIMRTPEGKIWQAERKREKERVAMEEKQDRASNSNLQGVTGGRFNMSKPKSEIDWMVHAARDIPAVGTYNPPPKRSSKTTTFGTSHRALSILPPGHEHVPGVGEYDFKMIKSVAAASGGKFNNSDRKGFLDFLQKEASNLPGPGEYDVPEGMPVGPEGFFFGGGGKSRGVDEAAKAARGIPGPGMYDVLDKKELGKKGVPKFGIKAGSSFVDEEVKRVRDHPGPQDYNYCLDNVQPGGRFSQSSVPSNTDVLCREAAKIPGPGRYKVRNFKARDTNSELKGAGKFSQAVAATLIDQMAERSRPYPAPGAYSVERTATPKGVVGIHDSHVPSDLEWKLYHSRQLPGPGEYGAPMKPAAHSGVKISSAARKSDVDVRIRETRNMPGPGHYEVKGQWQGGGVVRLDKLPRSHPEWAQYEAHYPEMRFLGNAP